ncbi:FGFR1 oncogene partner 2 homolog [Asterias amurensis]|uniref:FGFR1 oncogene partner 2 homolog n=1 Tax=Asterias amurensis TaxID=7602 RepID=UPI003AB42797
MSLTIDQVLADAKRLVERLRDHDNAADSLIEQSSTLNKRIEAMKQYQEEVEEMNSVARHRPRSALILGIQQENRQIRELQRENRELRVALEEHQSALDLIMSSYREQICRMLMANRFDKDCLEKHAEQQEMSIATTAKIIEMAAVMKQAIFLEEKTSFDVEQKLTRLQVENRGLRELLEISRAVHTVHSPATQREDVKNTPSKDPAAKAVITDNKDAVSGPTDQPTPTRTELNLTPSSNTEKDSSKLESEAGEKTDGVKTSVEEDASKGRVAEGQGGGGLIDEEVESVLSAFDDMTAGLDMDDTESDA